MIFFFIVRFLIFNKEKKFDVLWRPLNIILIRGALLNNMGGTHNPL
jgi:hypothetical protein